MDIKKTTYETIEKNLKSIATLRRHLIVISGETEETVDKFISEIGQREIERTRNVGEIDLMMEMLIQMSQNEKSKNQKNEVTK